MKTKQRATEESDADDWTLVVDSPEGFSVVSATPGANPDDVDLVADLVMDTSDTVSRAAPGWDQLVIELDAPDEEDGRGESHRADDPVA